MSHYEKIAAIIRYLEMHQAEQPNLAELADVAGLSPYYFQRLFRQWAGVSPKAFLSCLTVAAARERLLSGESVLSTAIEVGLSGPSRLHDLCVTIEAATPGEIKRRGECWTLRWALVGTPFGHCLIIDGPRGVCHMSFHDNPTDSDPLIASGLSWPNASWIYDPAHITAIAEQIFVHDGTATHLPPLRAWVRGSVFQLRVWRALLTVPRGSLTSYSRLAEQSGHPGAARAVGTAVGSNPIAYLIPCHRVIRETGLFGAYRWGHIRKRILLAAELAATMPER